MQNCNVNYGILFLLYFNVVHKNDAQIPTIWYFCHISVIAHPNTPTSSNYFCLAYIPALVMFRCALSTIFIPIYSSTRFKCIYWTSGEGSQSQFVGKPSRKVAQNNAKKCVILDIITRPELSRWDRKRKPYSALWEWKANTKLYTMVI